MIAACDQIIQNEIDEAEERSDHVTYGYYKLDIPDTGEREVYKNVKIGVYDPIERIEINYSITNPGIFGAEVEISVELPDYPDLDRETVADKLVPSGSWVKGTIEDNESDLLSYVINDCDFFCDWTTPEEYVIRVWFKAIDGPPGLKAEFKIVVDDTNSANANK